METNQMIDIEKHLIQSELINQFEKIRIENDLSQKEFAAKLGFKPSFLSQLYAANKFFNLTHLAKIQRFFDVKIRFNFAKREDIRIERAPKRIRITNQLTTSFESTQIYPEKVEDFKISVSA